LSIVYHYKSTFVLVYHISRKSCLKKTIWVGSWKGDFS